MLHFLFEPWFGGRVSPLSTPPRGFGLEPAGGAVEPCLDIVRRRMPFERNVAHTPHRDDGGRHRTHTS